MKGGASTFIIQFYLDKAQCAQASDTFEVSDAYTKS
jgi:hypothetical protein